MRADGLFERESYNVLMYWGARRESAAECARRARHFFQALAECDPALRHWYTSGRSPRGTPGVPVDTAGLEALEKLLLSGRNRTDRGKRVIEDLGFYNHLWNEETPAIRLDIKCGCYSPVPPNRCTLGLPGEGTTNARLLNVPMLVRLMKVMVEAWDVDQGLVTTNNHTLLEAEKETRLLRAGWVTYLSHREGVVPPLPASVRVEPLGEHGTLIVLPMERFTADNPEHLALAEQVRQRLAEAGLRDAYKR